MLTSTRPRDLSVVKQRGKTQRGVGGREGLCAHVCSGTDRYTIRGSRTLRYCRGLCRDEVIRHEAELPPHRTTSINTVRCTRTGAKTATRVSMATPNKQSKHVVTPPRQEKEKQRRRRRKKKRGTLKKGRYCEEEEGRKRS